MEWSNKVVLITGGSGTIGHALTRRLLKEPVQSIRIYSRDERKQEDMARLFSDESNVHGGRLRFLIGDVRDKDRLRRAVQGVDYVIHAAALKIVPACAYNPTECAATNVQGTHNIILTSLDANVSKVVMLSTDKACEAVTVYGTSKAMAEQLVVSCNNYAGDFRHTRSCVVRYGNVVNSRGSVLPLFLQQRLTGEITVTDPRSTRFWITQDQAVELILIALETTRGGEIFIPKAPSMRVTDLAAAVASGARVRTIGLRTQEKLHEVLVTYEEARRTKDAGAYYVIEPDGACWDRKPFDLPQVPIGFRYLSSGGTQWVTADEFRRQAAEVTP